MKSGRGILDVGLSLLGVAVIVLGLAACSKGSTVVDEPDQSTTVCQPQLRRCNGSALEVCSLDGSGWEVLETCVYGCAFNTAPARCYALCPPGHKLCYQERLVTCNPAGDEWLVEQCPNGCNEEGNPPACFVSCAPGSKVCDGDFLKTCNEQGNGLEQPATCGNGCNADKQPNDCYALCRPGTTRCFGTAILETCNADGDKFDRQTCDTGCNSGVSPHACYTDCRPGATRCKDDKTLQTCNSEGNGWNDSPCSEGCNGTLDPPACQVCKPKSKKCDGKELKTCLDSGIGYESTGCNIGCNALSDPPSCYGTCTPFERRCSGNVLQECDQTGNSWGTIDDCSPYTCDSQRLECQGCAPNEKRCKNGNLEQCKSDGSQFDPLADCGSKGCDEQNLACYAVCKPGKVCNGDVLEVCNSAGTEKTSETCTYGCDANNGVCYPELTLTVGGDVFVFENQAASIGANATGGDGTYSYLWKPARGLSDPKIANPSANPSETTTYRVTVTDGQGNSLTKRVTVVKYNRRVDLQEWDEVYLKTPNNTTDPDLPVWLQPDSDPETPSFERTVTGKTHGAILVSPFVLKNVIVTGRFVVSGTTDDDYLGFVFGYQNEHQFYAFDWKKTSQSYSECGGYGNNGMRLKLFDSDAPIVDCAAFWKSDVSTLADVDILVPAGTTPKAWANDVTYRFELRYKPAEIQVTIYQEDQMVPPSLLELRVLNSTDATFDEGRIGLYTYSQEKVKFFDVTINPLP
ncbi:MAG: hypothetical protein KC609_07855 [Myxococcales bacterium]|nr:hypothetical protein [Myxococcales bacterium]